MSIQAVRSYLKKFGAEDRIMEFDVSSATVELAAEALHCEPAHIAKTLSFYGKEGCILVVAAGDARIDNAKFRKHFGLKAKMLTCEDVEEKIGHGVGGVCPFAVKEGVSVYLDESLKRFSFIFPACGSANSAIRLNCEELAEFSGSREWVDVCKGWQLPETE